MPSIITENTGPPPPKDPRKTGTYYNHPGKTFTPINVNKSQIKPNISPIPTSRKPITSKNPFSGGKKSRKRRIRKSKKYGKYRKQNKKTFRFF